MMPETQEPGARVPDDPEQAFDPPRDGLVRARFSEPVGIRSASDGSDTPGVMFGQFASFDEWTEIDSALEGHFMECVAPGAFKKTVQENADRMKVLYHHGRDPATGVRPLGVPLMIDPETSEYEVGLFDTTYVRELVPMIQAGQCGSSYRFRIIREDRVMRPGKSSWNPHGLPERTMLELAVPEFGPTPFPQYAGAGAGMRSLTDELALEALAEDPERLRELARRSGISLAGVDVPTVPIITITGATQNSADMAAAVVRELKANPGKAFVLPDARERVRTVQETRLYERAWAIVTEHPWVIHPAWHELMVAILSERRDGYKPTEEEIAARIGERAEDPPETPAGSPVQVINISGPITPHGSMMGDLSGGGGASVDAIQAQLRDAMSDPQVSAVLLNVDSPGGSSELIQELADEIYNSSQEKPIEAVANTMAASGAYWLASQVPLSVTPSGSVGSIGVYTSHRDTSAQMEKAGVKPTVVSAGKYKTELHSHAPLTEDAQGHLQDVVDGIYEKFLSAVGRGRGVDAETVRNGFGEGRMVFAEQAVAEGMVDRIETFDEALARLVDEHGAAPAAESAGASHATPARRGGKTLAARKDQRWRL